MVKLILDQMIDDDIALMLKTRQYNVTTVSEMGLSTADDSEIMRTAIKQNRTLVTLDEHFGDWAVLPLKSHPGVIRLKVHPATTKNIGKLLLAFLEIYSSYKFENLLVIAGTKNIRWIKTT